MSRVVHVPTVDEEDRRHTHRERTRLRREHTRGINRIKGLLAGHGVRLTTRHKFEHSTDRAVAMVRQLRRLKQPLFTRLRAA